MNREKIINNMISFIEEKEKEIQSLKMSSGGQNKDSDTVNAIISELESEMENEDQ